MHKLCQTQKDSDSKSEAAGKGSETVQKKAEKGVAPYSLKVRRVLGFNEAHRYRKG